MKHGAEFTAYRPEDVERVRRVLDRHRGPHLAATEVVLAEECGMPERRFRQIVTGHDGTRWLVAKCRGGIFLAVDPEDARALDAELRAKLDTLEARVGRRAWYEERMVAPQQLTLQGVA